jgi:hypothetical protein
LLLQISTLNFAPLLTRDTRESSDSKNFQKILIETL